MRNLANFLVHLFGREGVGQGERLELSHRAATRDHFARGAVRTAVWLVGRQPGLYRIEDVLGL